MKKNKSFVHYDAEADALALYLRKGKESEMSEVAPGVNAEFDKDGLLIGIEILNASKILQSVFQASQKKKSAYVR